MQEDEPVENGANTDKGSGQESGTRPLDEEFESMKKSLHEKSDLIVQKDREISELKVRTKFSCVFQV